MSIRIKLYDFSNFTTADQGHDGFRACRRSVYEVLV
jgi:hypothetical protein